MLPQIPRKALYRLSIYLRSLRILEKSGITHVSSEDLSNASGVKSTQLRKDLTYLGPLGTRGLGYPLDGLISAITAFLGTRRLLPVIVVGAGNLGSALLRYQGFHKEGYEILAAFDKKPLESPARDFDLPVLASSKMPAFIRKNQVKLAILCVPPQFSQDVTNVLVENGIQGILNFSPVVLHVPEQVMANNVDLALELDSLSYYIR